MFGVYRRRHVTHSSNFCHAITCWIIQSFKLQSQNTYSPYWIQNIFVTVNSAFLVADRNNTPQSISPSTSISLMCRAILGRWSQFRALVASFILHRFYAVHSTTGREKRDGLDMGRGTTYHEALVPLKAGRWRLMSHPDWRGLSNKVTLHQWSYTESFLYFLIQFRSYSTVCQQHFIRLPPKEATLNVILLPGE